MSLIIKPTNYEEVCESIRQIDNASSEIVLGRGSNCGELIMSLVIGHWFKIQMTSDE